VAQPAERIVSRLRFGVVGCGAISTIFQLPALERSSRLDLVAVADVDASWAASVARKFRVPEAYGDYTRMFERVDAVLVATPNTTHADIACDFLSRGVHVLCEKPLATSTAEVDRMLDAAGRGGARLMAAHCLRFSPNIATARSLVQRGVVGEVESISGAIGGVYATGPQRTDFRKTRGLSGGGVLIDLGVHLIDLALWISDARPTDLDYHATSAPGWEVESDVELALGLSGRTRASITASFSRPMNPRLRIDGSAGWIETSLYTPTSLAFFGKHARVCQRDGCQQMILDDTSMYDAQIDHFCDAIAARTDFVVRSAEIRAGMQVVEQCYANGGAQ
jgi:predicted dehydrogenase